jgi:hypothetical protein
VCIFSLSRCTVVTEEIGPNDMPGAIGFTLLDTDGNALIKSVNDTVKAFYIENNKKISITNLPIFPDSCKYGYIVFSIDMSKKSAYNNIKTFYIEFNNDVDTLYYDYVELDKPDYDLMSYYKLKSIKFNGVDVKYDRECRLYPFRR